MNSVGQQHIAICQQHWSANPHWIHLGVSCWWVNLSSVYNKIYSLPRLTLDWLIYAKIFVIILCLHEVIWPWSSRWGGGGGCNLGIILVQVYEPAFWNLPQSYIWIKVASQNSKQNHCPYKKMIFQTYFTQLTISWMLNGWLNKEICSLSFRFRRRGSKQINKLQLLVLERHYYLNQNEMFFFLNIRMVYWPTLPMQNVSGM